MKQYGTPKDAESFFFSSEMQETIEDFSIPITSQLHCPSVEDIQQRCMDLYSSLNPADQITLMSSLFECALKSRNVFVPADFLQLLINSMDHLQQSGRSNIFYQLAVASGTLRPDGSDSMLPARRVPTGLIEYCSIFYSTHGTRQVNYNLQCIFEYR